MTTRNVTFPILTAVCALLVFALPSAVRAQVYEGVVAEDDGAISDEMKSVYNYADGEEASDIFKPDYFATRAQKKQANRESYRAQAAAEREQAQAAREAEGAAAQEAIDARVETAVSAPSDYDSRIDGLKAPPPQMPETQPPETQPVVQPQPGTGTPGTGAGGGTGTGGGASGGGGDRGGSVLERMMNEIQ